MRLPVVAFTLSAMLLSGSFAVAVPQDLERHGIVTRDGLSGTVLHPPGGTNFEYLGGGAAFDGSSAGYIHVEYQGVNQESPFVQTTGIELYLASGPNVGYGDGMAYSLGNASYPGGLIDTYIIVPYPACGSEETSQWNLVFTEYQNVGNGQVISFQSAAPYITITCSTYPPPSKKRAIGVRDGPSGTVVYPPGGTYFERIGNGVQSTSSGGGNGYVTIIYQGVNQENAKTVGIDLYLEDMGATSVGLGYGFGNPTAGGLITASFIPPAFVCNNPFGDQFKLWVTEHQIYNGEVISFDAWAPIITIDCVDY